MHIAPFSIPELKFIVANGILLLTVVGSGVALKYLRQRLVDGPAL